MTFRTPLFLTVAFVCFAGSVHADVNSGAYLAARQAGISNDYAAASDYFANALITDPTNTALMEQTLTTYLGTGEIDSAAAIARPFIAAGGESQIASIALMAQAARAQDWPAIFHMLEAGQEVGPLIDGLAQAWAHIGQENSARAMQSFDELAETPGLRAFGQRHKALALEYLGDLAAAEAIYSLPPDTGLVPNRASVLSHVQVLAQLGQFERAHDILERAFGPERDPELTIFHTAIAAGEIPPIAPRITVAGDGIAYAFQALSQILQGEANESYLLLYAQAASFISPSSADAQLAAARLLNALDQYDAAAQTFARVATNDPAFHAAEIGRAEALRLAGRIDQAIEVLTQLTRSHPDLAQSFVSLGDIYRRQENFTDAVTAYDAALAIYPETATFRWWLLYSRGISYERLNEWPAAEADFRASLALNPDNPSVLNYLGYSMVDRGQSENYAEALTMIETAVAARPDSGAITDSLAWVYYKLGRYQEAVTPMERAAELEPNDPVVSDHLGDVYWMVGRFNEAQFQWHRALSFDDDSDLAIRVRRKLAIGLDAVYAEDGDVPAPAVEVANGDN